MLPLCEVAGGQTNQEGCSLHQILPRTLARLADGNPGNDKAKRFEMAFDAVGLTVDMEDNETRQGQEADWLDKLPQLDLTDDPARQDLSFAEINQKRKQLTFKAFKENNFTDKIIVLDDLVSPNVELMYRLFARTGNLGDLRHMPKDPEKSNDEDAAKLRQMAQQLLARTLFLVQH